LWAGKFHPAGRRSRGATPFVGAPGGGTDWHFISAAVGLPAPLPGSPNQQPLTCSNNGNNKLSKQLGKQPGSTGEKLRKNGGKSGGKSGEMVLWVRVKKEQLLTYSKARTSHNLHSFLSPSAVQYKPTKKFHAAQTLSFPGPLPP